MAASRHTPATVAHARRVLISRNAESEYVAPVSVLRHTSTTPPNIVTRMEGGYKITPNLPPAEDERQA
jgi:hypothetical protein